MNALKILTALLVMAVFVTARPVLAGDNQPFYEDKLYESQKSEMENPAHAVGSGWPFEDRYENFLYETEEGMSAEGEINRTFGIESSWEFEG